MSRSLNRFVVAFSLLALSCQANLSRAAKPEATPVSRIKVAKGFKVERLYSVPSDQQGSWVNMCVDPKGRLIVSDQYGGLFRVTPPPLNSDADIKIEKIDVNIGEAQGLLWAFDSLYVVVNRGRKYASGLYRVTDTNNDDKLDKLEKLRDLKGGGEHGPHAILKTQDGKNLIVVCGNKTDLTKIDQSRVPQNWDEDNLLPRPYGRGFMKGVPAPGGCIYQIDPEGKNWTLLASGFRNQYDAALNADGELFSYDADMEWDMNTPWYRPTRVCHVVSGAEFGWRNGGGKWPAYYPDSVPGAVDIGPGSPTGICFGYGTKYPAKYQNALYICDWSYGKLYAIHLAPDGSTYNGKIEEFVTGTPLPLTDAVVRPQDGALYFAIGGRRVQSGLYRVTYIGNESTAKADATNAGGKDLRQIRRDLEALHLGDHPEAVEKAWPYLNHNDRMIRYAARVALEHRPVSEWQDKALAEKDPQKALGALLALARVCKRDNIGKGALIDPLPPLFKKDKQGDQKFANLRGNVFEALQKQNWDELSKQQRIDLLRVYAVTFCRMGPPTLAQREKLIETFGPKFPAATFEVNAELAELLVYLQSADATPKIVAQLLKAPTQEQQIDFAKTLRHARSGWTNALREQYFKWFNRAARYRGGAAFSLFVTNIKADAVSKLSKDEKSALKPILDAKPKPALTFVEDKPRKIVKKYSMDDLAPLMETKLKNRDLANGKKMFAVAKCFACHRFDNQGGAIGPDLTSLAGRFSSRDILESIVDPSKQISDQYESVNIVTVDGDVVTGRIVNLAGDKYMINTDMLDPSKLVNVKVDDIEEIAKSKISMMPKGLLDTLSEDEVLDLMAYLLSRGQKQKMDAKP